MPHTINRLSDVEYELEVEATAEELSPELDAAVRKQRSRTELKGFRPGKVPSQLVRKMYGKALAYGVAEDRVQTTYRREVVDGDVYDVLGQPTITELEYEYGGDLKAKVRFGVRPEFDLQSLDGAQISRMEHVVEDDEVTEELERMREQAADLSPAEGPTHAESFLLTDIYEVNEESGELTGDHRHDVAFFLGSDELIEETREALVGLNVGESARVRLVKAEDDSEALFEVRIKEIKLRELPEMDDDFATTVSKGSIEKMDELRAEIAKRMQRSVHQTGTELFEGALVREVIDRHEFEVPESVVDMYVEGRLEDFKKQAGDRLPPDFDEEAFMAAGREDSARQARWVFIRDRVVTEEDFKVTEADREAYFEETAEADGLSADMLKQYYRTMPKLISQLDERLITKKVLDHFAAQATIVTKDREAMRAEAEAERGE